MVAIDTNVLIRFLAHDNNPQFEKAYELFENNEVFLADTVILESEWVLRYTYEFGRNDIHNAFATLLGLPEVHVSNPLYLAQALAWYKQGLDFSDAMHLAQCQEYENFYTFDKKLITKAKELSECPVIEP